MKKSIALFLALMMILSLMPVLSVAEDAPVVTVVQVDANLTQTELKKSAIIRMWIKEDASEHSESVKRMEGANPIQTRESKNAG